MSRKILVTGGLGFIGSHLVESLVKKKYRVYIIDNYFSPALKRNNPPVKIIKADISSPEIVKTVKTISPEVIIHLAADNRVTATFSDVLHSNVIGTYNLLEAGRIAKIKQFIFSSSAAVYGDPEFLPLTENHPTKPLSSYGISKLVDELYIRQFQDYFYTSIFRFANVYGPRQSSQSEGGVIPIFISHLLHHQKPIIYGNGSQTRDFIYVADVVNAITLALTKPTNFTLNIGSESSISVIKLFTQLALLMKVKPLYYKKPFRPIEIRHSYFDASSAKKILNWHPAVNLDEGLSRTITYFQSL